MACMKLSPPLRILAACLTALLPHAAMAQDKVAYVIGNARFGGPALEHPAKDAVSISLALLGLGFNVVRRENTNAADFPLGSRAGETVALYYSGRTTLGDDGDIVLRGAQLGASEASGWPLAQTVRAFQEAGAQRVLVFIETCQAEGDTLSLPQPDLDGVFLAFSHDPDLGCPTAAEPVPDDDAAEASAEPSAEEPAPQDAGEAAAPADAPVPRFTERVRLALATPDQHLADAMDAAAGLGWQRSSLTEPLFLWPQPEGDAAPVAGRLPDGALDMLAGLPEADQARMRAVWQEAGLIDAEGRITDPATRAGPQTIIVSSGASSSGISIVAPAATALNPIIPQGAPGGTRPTGGAASVQPAAQTPQAGTGDGVAPGAGGGGGAVNAVQIFTPAPRSAAPAALPTEAGLPEPYLIFGEIRPTNASFNPTDTGEIAGNVLDTSSFETRNQIRNDTPDVYAQLVASGAFDPEDGSASGVARAIQTELARMNCYTSTIDGIWGGGSRNSVSAYFQQIGETPSGLEPTLDLFRRIILNDDVSCPAVQQAAQPNRAATGTTTRTNTPAPAARTPAPAQAPAASGGINTNNLGTGVFR